MTSEPFEGPGVPLCAKCGHEEEHHVGPQGNAPLSCAMCEFEAGDGPLLFFPHPFEGPGEGVVPADQTECAVCGKALTDAPYDREALCFGKTGNVVGHQTWRAEPVDSELTPDRPAENAARQYAEEQHGREFNRAPARRHFLAGVAWAEARPPADSEPRQSPFREVVDALTEGCGCACHTGTGYNSTCLHCHGTAPVPAPRLDEQVASARRDLDTTVDLFRLDLDRRTRELALDEAIDAFEAAVRREADEQHRPLQEGGRDWERLWRQQREIARQWHEDADRQQARAEAAEQEKDRLADMLVRASVMLPLGQPETAEVRAWVDARVKRRVRDRIEARAALSNEPAEAGVPEEDE